MQGECENRLCACRSEEVCGEGLVFEGFPPPQNIHQGLGSGAVVIVIQVEAFQQSLSLGK